MSDQDKDALAQQAEQREQDLLEANQSLRDMLDDARADLAAVRQALGVHYEPHQSLQERTLLAAQQAEREPLAKRAILDLVPTTMQTANDIDLLWFARAVERAHRIGDPHHPAQAGQAPAPAHEVPAGYKLVMVPDELPGGEPDWDEVRRQAEVSSGIKVGPEFSILIREVRRWLCHRASQAPAVGAVTMAAQDVLAERQRQISSEGWTPHHDDEHGHGELSKAASAYALGASYPTILGAGNPPDCWPWDVEWWKPSEPRRMLVKAGALILAEIERLDRAGGTT